MALTLDGRGAFPQHIYVAGSSLSQAPVTPVRRYTFNLALWPTFKRAYYLSDFTESARQLFDDVTEAAEKYNDAMARVQDPTLEVLAPIIDDAILKAKSSPEYQEWHRKYPTETAWTEASRRGETTPTWYRRLDTEPFTNMTQGHAWASSWIYSWPIQHEPETIAYLLSGDVQRATSTIYRGFQPGIDPPAPPLEWLEDICKTAEPQLHKLVSYQNARATRNDLYKAASKAEEALLDALNQIQQRYEGGEPPL